MAYDIQKLVGKKIKTIAYRDANDEDCNYDDEPYLDIEFTDGTKVTAVATYGDYTGNSMDEYPRYIFVKQDDRENVEVKENVV
jgi:hypothetical protein